MSVHTNVSLETGIEIEIERRRSSSLDKVNYWQVVGCCREKLKFEKELPGFGAVYVSVCVAFSLSLLIPNEMRSRESPK